MEVDDTVMGGWAILKRVAGLFCRGITLVSTINSQCIILSTRWRDGGGVVAGKNMEELIHCSNTNCWVYVACFVFLNFYHVWHQRLVSFVSSLHLPSLRALDWSPARHRFRSLGALFFYPPKSGYISASEFLA